MSDHARGTVLIVEDEFIVAESFAYQIEQSGLTVCGIAATREAAIALALEHHPSLVLMDVRLQGGQDGVATASAILAAIDTKVVFLTGSMEPETVLRMSATGASATLFKPVSGAKLVRTVEQFLPA